MTPTTRAELKRRLAEARALRGAALDRRLSTDVRQTPQTPSYQSSPWQRAKTIAVPSSCKRCLGRGVIREVTSRDNSHLPSPFIRCPCGRLPDSVGARLLSDQDLKQKRLDELKKVGWR